MSKVASPSKNKALDPESKPAEFRAIPFVVGVKRQQLTIKAEEMPDIPDKPMSFRKIGEFMDNFEGGHSQSRAPTSPSAEDRDAKDKQSWKKMEEREETRLRRSESEYERLVKEIQSELG